MKVKSTLRNYKVGDFVLVLPVGMEPWEEEFNKIRDKYYATDYELDDSIKVGEVRELGWNESDNEILLGIKFPDLYGTQFYILDRVIPFGVL